MKKTLFLVNSSKEWKSFSISRQRVKSAELSVDY